MTALTKVNQIGTSTEAALFNPAQLALIKRTMAPDCNADEFELYITTARALKLDPRRRQIYALVYGKTDPKKRRMSMVVGIDGFRSVAARSGNYRPDDEAPVYLDGPKDPLNPAGIVSVRVRVWKHSHGDWHPIMGEAFWSEYAPIDEEWKEGEDGKRRPTGKKKLGGKWGQMPRFMIAKCAEALALRKAWPDDFSNVYEEAEMDRASLDLTATEIMDEGARQERMDKIGGPTLIVDWIDGNALDSVPIGQFADRVISRMEKMEPSEVAIFADRNRATLRHFWGHSPTDALELKRRIEATAASMKDQETPSE